MGFGEPGARILKDLAKEMKDLAASDRVVLIGESKQPWLCEKGDQKKFLSFFKMMVYVPICDYGSLQYAPPLPCTLPFAQLRSYRIIKQTTTAGTCGATTCNSLAFPTPPTSNTWTSALSPTCASLVATLQAPLRPPAQPCALSAVLREWRPSRSQRLRSRLL